MTGHKRYRAGAWDLIAPAPNDPVTGKRRQVRRRFHAPDTRAGAHAASVALAKLVVEVDTQRTVPTSGITVGQLLDRYVLDHIDEWEGDGVDSTRARAARHITPYLGDLPASRLTPADIKHWHAQLRGYRDDKDRALSPSTISRVHSVIQAALAWAVDLELIDRNVAARRKPRAARSRRTAPADDVMVALLASASGDLVTYLRLAAVTGARRGTLVALRWSKVNLDAGTVVFDRAHAKVKGGIVEKGTKADVDYKITLDARTVEVLRAHRARALERALAAEVKLLADGFVFTRAETPDGRLAWYPDGANQRFNRIRSKVPGAEKVTPHQFRHWMATAMFEDGSDAISVAARGGWASPAVPLAVYGHHRGARDSEVAESLANRLDSVSSESGGPG